MLYFTTDAEFRRSNFIINKAYKHAKLAQWGTGQVTQTLELMSRKCTLISCGGLKLNLNTQDITTSAMFKITST